MYKALPKILFNDSTLDKKYQPYLVRLTFVDINFSVFIKQR